MSSDYFVKIFSLYILVILLMLPGFTLAADGKEASVSESTDTEVENQFSCYGGDTDSDDDDTDNDGLPENVINTMYENGRMAFLFGKFEIAYQAWEPLAQKGYAKAQASLGWMYHTGNGVSRDIKQAKGWYTLAAEQNHAIAQNNLAVFYENGMGVTADAKTAFKWYQKSAESGYGFAQYNLGRMYEKGLGTTKDIEKARYWWRSASQFKVKEATEALARLENTPLPNARHSAPTAPIAHAPYHANPVAKGIAWVKKQEVNHYTIQLFRSQDPQWILKLATSEQLPQVFTQIMSTDSNGNKWYTLIYGSFPNFQDAESARKALPDNLKKWSPKLRRFGEIHKLLK